LWLPTMGTENTRHGERVAEQKEEEEEEEE
jgi:hypothetical protein